MSSASFAAAGVLVVVGLGLAWRDRAAARWLAGAVIAIVLAGLAWAIVIWLPNRDAVSMDFRIWEQFQLRLAPQAMWRSAVAYLRGSDGVLGPVLAPLLALAAAGIVATLALRRRLGKAEARLALAAAGWAAFGFGILMVVQYRPNRYVVPLVPALAILAAVGLHLAGLWLRERFQGDTGAPAEIDAAAAGSAAAAGGTAAAGSGRMGRVAGPALAAVAILLAAGPGLSWYATWAGQSTGDLTSIQNDFAPLVPAGQTVAGRDSALYLMKSRAVTLITQVANEGDLYARGTRYYLLPADAAAPTGVSAAAWTARERIRCATYGAVTECLFHVP